MNAFEKIVVFLSAEMPEPHSFGWFHFLWLGLFALALFLLVRFYKKDSERVFKRFSLWLGFIMWALDIYKQLVFSYDGATDEWAYAWSSFPFQFCSMPMYFLPAVAFLKDGKLRRALCAFLATYGFVGGFAVILYPETVFVSTIGVNIQTTVHHGGMVLYAVYLFLTKRVKTGFCAVKTALPVFAVSCVAALLLNLLYGDGKAFNMFFIAPGGEYIVPIVHFIFSRLPYIVYLVCYLVFFTLAAHLVAVFFKIFEKK